MISIRRYLNADRTAEAPEPKADGVFSEELYEFASAILGHINQYVLTGEASQPLRSQLLQVRDALRPDLRAEEASAASQTVSAILSAHQASSQQAAVHQLMEAQNIFALLNQALVVFAEGNDRDVSRLAAIQESLQRTSRMRDMSSMKASLADAVQFIKAETAEARELAAKELGQFETEVTRARDFFAGTRLELAGRPEGVAEIANSLKALVSGDALYLVAYLCDRLAAVTQRYGPGVADELISRLIKERLKPVMPGNTMYRWTPYSLVAVFSRPRNAEKVRKEVTELNRTPLVHKIAIGGRTAVLTISPSHLVAEGVSGSPAALVEQVDRFTQSGG